jgi:hypothetical protein
MSRALTRSAALVALAALSLACGARTDLGTVWNAKMPRAPVTRILVIGIAENSVTKRSFEDAFAAELNQRGAEAAPSYMFLPPDERLSEEMVREVVRQRGIEAVVVTRLLKVDEDKQYIPPRTDYVSRGYAGGLYGYYGSAYDVVHTPGYWQTVTIVRLETRLYDAETADLIWAAQSDTFDPSSTDDTIKSVTKAVAKRIAADGLIAKR